MPKYFDDMGNDITNMVSNLQETITGLTLLNKKLVEENKRLKATPKKEKKKTDAT